MTASDSAQHALRAEYPNRVNLPELVREHPLASFFILAFGCTWAIEIPMLTLHVRALEFVIGWMPGLAALLVAGAIGGRNGVTHLLRGLVIWRVGVQWYAVAIFGFLGLWFATQALDALVGGSGLQMPSVSLALLISFTIELLARMLLSSEQLAWSGFALPRLQARHSALLASIVLGVIWACWHLPLFFVPGSQRDAGFGVFLLGAICTRILLTWMFNNTEGSVLLCTLLHQSINSWSDLLAPWTQANDQWAGLAVNVLITATIVIVFGARRLSNSCASVKGGVHTPTKWMTAPWH